ncbi:MAG: Exodeoxyribonuclease 7 small subunit [Candidatus Saccharibacteria bacterium]|nr:Exodeoxyribonuclease 7 small subunit [Candidatus Saccharibacteria bacterium]
MATSKKSAPTYQALNEELEIILNELQREDTDVDTALKQYERGLELVQQLEGHLKSAENTVLELKAKFSTEA